MRASGLILATVAALVIQTTLARFAGYVPFDLVLIMAVAAGIKNGPVAGLLTGTFGGLLQDAMASGIIGIGAWAKTTVGFLAGVIGTQFIVAKPAPRLVVLAGATIVHALVFAGLYAVLGLRDAGFPWSALAVQVAANAIIGVVLLEAVESLPGALDRRRAGRTRTRR